MSPTVYNLRSWQRRCLREVQAALLKAPQLSSGLGPTASIEDLAKISRYWKAVGPAIEAVVETFLYPDAPREAAEEAARDLAEARAAWLEENP